MKYHGVGGFIALSLAIGGLLADDFWQRKKFTEWNRQEVAKILSDSPWAKTFTVHLRGFGGGRGGDVMDGIGMGGEMSAEGESGMGGAGDLDGGGSAGTKVTIRWYTALPVKQAVARARFGAEAGTSEEAAQNLTRREQIYIIGIVGIPTKAITVKPDALKSHAELRIKDHPAIQPTQVQVLELRLTTMVYLVFPRFQQGVPEITVADNEVEVFLQLEAGKISRKFRLRDMVFDGKLEL